MKAQKSFLLLIACFAFAHTASAQAVLEADICPGSCGGNPSAAIHWRFTEFNGKLYFSANDGVNGAELWSYDGATATLEADINPGSGWSQPAYLTVFNNKLYFSANDGVSGRELWSYDGTTATLEANISSSSNPAFLTVFNNKLYFKATDEPLISAKSSLWSYDGTTATLEAHIEPGPTLTVFNNKLYFNGWINYTTGNHLWSYDGATATLEANIQPSIQTPIRFLTVFNNKLYFGANDGVTGIELWSYDGATATLEADIRPGSGGSALLFLTVFNNKLYFRGNDGVTGNELWSYDGATATLEAEINPGSGHSGPQYLAVFNNKLYFSANDGVSGRELWSYDGTTATLEADIRPGSIPSFPQHLTVFNNKLYFNANDGVSGIELWSFTPPCPAADTPCDDGNACTVNDVEDGNCNCAGVAANISVVASNDTFVYNGYAPWECVPLSVVSIAGGAAPYMYEWSTGETASDITVCPATSATYSVTVTDANGCSGADDVDVTVYEVNCGNNGNNIEICITNPSGNSNTICVDTNAAANLLANNPNAFIGNCTLGMSSPGQEETIAPNIGEYKVSTLRTSIRQEETIEPNVGNLFSPVLEIYPNPASGKVMIVYNDLNPANNISVMDIQGKVVREYVLEEPTTSFDQVIEIVDIADGIYLIAIRDKGAVLKTAKLVKSNK